MVNFNFLPEDTSLKTDPNDGSGVGTTTAALGATNPAQEFINKMALVPLTDFDTKTLALFSYTVFSVVFLCFVCCMARKSIKRSELQKRLKNK